MQSELRLPKCAAERTHRGKMRTEKKAAFAVEVGRCMGCACRSARRSERIAARCGRKRKPPSQWKSDAAWAALAEARDGVNASRQDTGGKDYLRGGRRMQSELRLPKNAAKKSYRRLAAVARLAFLRLFVAAGGSAVGAEPLFAFRAVVAQHGPAYRTATQRACVRGAMAHGAFHHRHSKHPFAKTSPARMARKISRAFALRVCSAKGYFMRHGSF